MSKIDMDRLKTLRESGFSYSKIAEIFGVSSRTVGMAVRKAGLTRKPKPKPTRSEIVEAVAKHDSIRAAARALGVDPRTVRKHTGSVSGPSRERKARDTVDKDIDLKDYVDLVIRIAKTYARRGNGDAEARDFWAWGWMGLEKALLAWDGVRPFRPYAERSVMSTITREDARFRFGFHPDPALKLLGAMRKENEAREKIGERPMSIVDVAKKIGVSSQMATSIYDATMLHRVLPGSTSTEDDRDLLDGAVFGSRPWEFDGVEDCGLVDEEVSALLDSLKARSRDVIESIYFDDEERPDVARRLGVTRQRVDQIEKKALKDMKRTRARRKLAAELRRKMGGSPKE